MNRKQNTDSGTTMKSNSSGTHVYVILALAFILSLVCTVVSGLMFLKYSERNPEAADHMRWDPVSSRTAWGMALSMSFVFVMINLTGCFVVFIFSH